MHRRSNLLRDVNDRTYRKKEKKFQVNRLSELFKDKLKYSHLLGEYCFPFVWNEKHANSTYSPWPRLLCFAFILSKWSFQNFWTYVSGDFFIIRYIAKIPNVLCSFFFSITMQRAELKQHDNVRNEEEFEVNTQKSRARSHRKCRMQANWC